MARTHRITHVLPLIAGALVGFGVYRYLTAVDAVELSTRDRRTRAEAPIRSHRAPAPPSLDTPAGPHDEAAAARPTPGAGPAIAFAPRDAAEWQGMLVNTTFQASCDTSARCGLAMACSATGRCGPCTRDADCATGEACAMQHCVPAAAVACKSRVDCPAGELCMLTGYSEDPRGNGDLRAYCSGSPPALARTVERDEAELEELARAEPAPLATDDPGTPEGLVHLLQD